MAGSKPISAALASHTWRIDPSSRVVSFALAGLEGGELRGAGGTEPDLVEVLLDLLAPIREVIDAPSSSIPTTSAMPFLTGPHSTPSRRVSS